VERAIGRPEWLFCVFQGREDELAVQALHLFDEPRQLSRIKLSGRIVQQQRWDQGRLLAEHFQLCQDHGRRDEFLLAARQDFPCSTPLDANLDVGAMRA
jgi:hypothetical protein